MADTEFRYPNNINNMENNKKIIICVGRQLGSGGHIIAKKLAQEFGCKFYDRELLNLAARESGFNEKFFEQNDEKKGFFKSMFHIHVPLVPDNNFYNNKLSQESLFQIQSDAIRKAAETESCVFVGRCADYILRDMDNMVSVFITSDMEERIAEIRRRHSCTEEEAEKIIETQEDNRSSYYNYYTGKTWGHSASYDLCINSSLLGLEETVKYISAYIRSALAIKG